MRRLLTIARLGRVGLLVWAIACLGAVWSGAASAGAATLATTPWSPVVAPWGAAWSVYDVYAFGVSSLAATGEDGHIAVTRDGGGSWTVVVPDGLGASVFTAIALDKGGHGAVSSGGLLLVTDDGGGTWRAPVYAGPGPGAAINDIAVRGSRFVAVGDDGVIMISDDSGSTWRRSDSPTEDALTSVAIAGDGTVVAGSEAGEVLVGGSGGDSWKVAATAAGPVTSVDATHDPVWGDGRPDLIAPSGGDVLGSDDALAFATLPGLPAPGSQPWSTVAWSGVPDGSLLIAGGEGAGFLETVSHEWLPGQSGLGSATRGAAPADQSVAYLLGADGRLVRTFSAGREPAIAALARERLVVGQSTRLTATVRVGAPGRVLLRTRIPGRAWETQRAVAWTADDWNRRVSFSLSPSLTHEYVLQFQYAGTTVDLTSTTKVVVTPKVGTARARYDLRRGDVFRFSGSVTPELAGERVELFTDRGGKWRPVSLQRSVGLEKGRSWTSRRFGTPKRETYHLRAHLKRTAKHAEAWSRGVTGSIR
jgi:hypothetical protein